MLFGQEQTNYDKISAMVKEFTPYSNLWTTAEKWNKSYQIWLKDPFNTVDAVAAERFVEESSKLLNGVNRFFKDRGLTDI